MINVDLERCSVVMSPLETLVCFPGQESLSRPPRMDARGRGFEGRNYTISIINTF